MNLFADMGVQPDTIQLGLSRATRSTDLTRPTSTVTSPAGGTSFVTGTPVTITGTATDGGGGVIGGVLHRLSNGEHGSGITVIHNTARTTLRHDASGWAIHVVTDHSHLELVAP